MSQTTVNAIQPNGYVLLTAVYNEEDYIEKTIQSVLSQSVLPQRWIIISDGSTDRTDEIVQACAVRFDLIGFVRMGRKHPRNFGSKGEAIIAGYERLKGVSYEFIGNLDGDVWVDRSYYASLLEKFAAQPDLGLAGGFVLEKQQGEFRSRKTNRVQSVAHAAQLVRRECYESIGGYVPLPYGGEDWYAEVSARMQGWRATSFPELKVLHLRPTGTAEGRLRHCFRGGQLDNSLGSHPMFEIAKCVRRIPERPILLGAFTRLVGFIGFYIFKKKRVAPKEFIHFLRREQTARLLQWFP